MKNFNVSECSQRSSFRMCSDIFNCHCIAIITREEKKNTTWNRNCFGIFWCCISNLVCAHSTTLYIYCSLNIDLVPTQLSEMRAFCSNWMFFENFKEWEKKSTQKSSVLDRIWNGIEQSKQQTTILTTETARLYFDVNLRSYHLCALLFMCVRFYKFVYVEKKNTSIIGYTQNMNMFIV